ncbi:MAG: ribosome maturation factor RimP [Acidobacteria bacterium]|jgi:ribosome maturation factor RimP|nr:ribosome maturation factor RimP [Acidobacteriota bacterium]
MIHSIDEQIRKIAARAAEENGLEFVHAEVVGTKRNLTVRVFIDKEGGVTHEDCVLVSRQMEAVLDAEDIVALTYTLEVSSPGLERGLYNLKDFEKFAGNLAKVKTETAINGQKNFRGRIVGVEGEEIIFDDKTKGNVRFPYSAVVKANLEIDLEKELKRNEKRKVENG